MSNLVLGLDIGISSVGWAVVNRSTGKIVDCGVRLFEEGLSAENVKRRTYRSRRRLIRRKANRLGDLRKIFEKYKIEFSQSALLDNPYDCRVKGLNEKLDNQELITALYHLVKKRGSSLESVEEEAKGDEQSVKVALSVNDHLIKNGKFICEIQKERLDVLGKLRGHQNNFRTVDYVNECKQILSNQDRSKDFQQDILDLVERRRHFSDGPGSEKSPTIYGKYILNDSGEIEVIDLIEKMRGHCSVYPDELRAPKLAPSTELFNFLNDLNNISVDGEQMTTDFKREIIQKYILSGKHSLTYKQLVKKLEVPEERITGYRVNAKEEGILSEFKGLKLLMSVFDDDRRPFFTDNLFILDQISEVLNRSKVINDRVKGIMALNCSGITLDDARNLASLKGFSQYHSLSLKAIYELLSDLFETSDNQMQILHRKKLTKLDHKKFVGLKNIPLDNEAILSPVAKKAQREALKIVNQARKIFGEFDQIVIELAREKNSNEVKSKIRKRQAELEKSNKELMELAEKEINTKTKIKLMLYKQQDGKCIYTGEPLDLDLILSDTNAYEIDHIIPVSISLDDSLNNKVLVTRHANQIKGKLTPLMCFRYNRFDGWSEAVYRSFVEQKYKSWSLQKKKDYLLFEPDITKFDVMKDFINRNLVDTRYATRTVLNTLQGYFSANQFPTRVLTVKGSITSTFRNKIGIEKDRDKNYLHHAIDAGTIALISMQDHIKFLYDHISYDDTRVSLAQNVDYDPALDYNEFFSLTFMQYLVQLKDLSEREDIKVSHKVDKKPNRQISDDTIYSTRFIEGKEKVVKKYKDIYNPKDLKMAEKIVRGEHDDFLMYHHDKKTYDLLRTIVDNYVIEHGKVLKENPFFLHLNKHGKIRKYSKNGDGPEIVSVKYFDGFLGNHLSISHNYKNSQRSDKMKNVVLLQIKPYRTDIFITSEGRYKLITIRYSNVRFISDSKSYIIDECWYESEKSRKGISKNDQFLFSLHRNEYIEVEKKKNLKDGSYIIERNIYKFTATNNDKTNTIEVKPISYYEKKQLTIPIGSSISCIKKFNCDILGNITEVAKEQLKLEFKLDRM
jgi:CRISPR-associated endonuclease Csn1